MVFLAGDRRRASSVLLAGPWIACFSVRSRGTPPAYAAPPSDVWVRADAVRLRQVLVNLLSNAVKYNKPGGSVALTWKLSGNECEVLISDTGRGIPADRLASLFQPFNRLGAESSGERGNRHLTRSFRASLPK